MKTLLLPVLALAASASLAGEQFPYDRQLAIDLSKAYLRSHAGTKGIELEMPAVISAVAARGRHLVFVSYAVKGRSNGAYVALELCSESKLLTVVDVGTVDPLSVYRAAIGRIDSKTFFAAPVVCPSDVP